MASKLVVVESPAKSRTLKKYLGSGFKVVSSVGHIIDLPAKDFGVELSGDFNLSFEPIKGKEKVIAELKREMKAADEIYLASDPDREGEAISYHLASLAPRGKTVHRVLFNAITKEVVQQAVQNPTRIDQDKVESQFARRSLDRIIGYKISPLLNRALYKGLSAGRVQSAALRMVVDREEIIRAFVPQEYWKLLGRFLTPRGDTLEAELSQVGGRRVEADKDPLRSQQEMDNLLGAITGKPATVAQVEKTTKKRLPPKPFITSTLQQAASSELGLSPKRTMGLAQALYENGHITYMRTDSIRIDPAAAASAQGYVRAAYGADYVGPGVFAAKTGGAKAQDAHEAVRPTDVNTRPGSLGDVDAAAAKLYDLIWRRFVASHMAPARLDHTGVDIAVGEATFRATGSVVVFDGWYRVEKPDKEDKLLPVVNQGESMDVQGLSPSQHFTEPPGRYTEAGLIKALEKEGIGRPSTYASILSVLTDRGYVEKLKNVLVPTQIGEDLNGAMKTHFPQVVDLGFTADMEKKLDGVEEGQVRRPELLRDFYADFETTLVRAQAGLKDHKKAQEVVTDVPCPKCGSPLLVRASRFGRFLGCSNWAPKSKRVEGKSCDFTQPLPNTVGAENLDENQLKALMEKSAETETLLGNHPETSEEIVTKDGPYGPYVQLGQGGGKYKPKRVSLPPGMNRMDVNYDLALGLLSLPRTLGQDPATGKDIKANIGRFGPYVQLDKTFASLKAEDDVLQVSLERALTLLGDKNKKATPIRELGPHPETGEPVAVFEGRFGPYVKHQSLNASLVKGADPMTISMEEAVSLLQVKAASGGTARKGRTGRAPAKTTGRKKAAAK